MVVEKSGRRMTLRQMLIHSEKCSRDIADRMQTNLLPHLTDFRKLTRPVRQHSHYPTVLATRNALKRLHEAAEETLSLAKHLIDMLKDISEQANREQRRG